MDYLLWTMGNFSADCGLIRHHLFDSVAGHVYLYFVLVIPW
jgi:hypothetical protein